MRKFVWVLALLVGLYGQTGLSEDYFDQYGRRYRVTTPVPAPHTFSELPRPEAGHWYGRVVERDRNVISTWNCYFVLNSWGEYKSRWTKVLDEPLPVGYQPGSYAAQLPVPTAGHWHERETTEKSNVVRIYDASFVINTSGFKEKQIRFLLEEPQPEIVKSVTKPVEPERVAVPEVKSSDPTEAESKTKLKVAPEPTEEPLAKSEATDRTVRPPSELKKRTEPELDIEKLAETFNERTPRPRSESRKKADLKAPSEKVEESANRSTDLERTPRPRSESKATLNSEDIIPKRPRLLPPSSIGIAPIVGEELSDLESKRSSLVKEGKSVIPVPEPLVEAQPSVASKQDWSERGAELFPQGRKEMVQLLGGVISNTGRWQIDLSKRFLNCNNGICIVRERGTEKIEIPFQVGLGRIWLLKIEAERLVFDLDKRRLKKPQEVSATLQLVRRMESLEALLEFSHTNSLDPYNENLNAGLDKAREITQGWNPFSTDNQKIEVLRWQLLAKDIRVFSERTLSLKKIMNAKTGILLKETSAKLEALLKTMGDDPWSLEPVEQYEIARKLYVEALAPVRNQYSALAREADALRGQSTNSINLLMVLGAAENIAIYSWTIMDDLANRDQDK